MGNQVETVISARDEASGVLNQVTQSLGGIGAALPAIGVAAAAAGGAFMVFRTASRWLSESAQHARGNIEAANALESAYQAAGFSARDGLEDIQDLGEELQRQGVLAGAATEELGAYLLNLGAMPSQVRPAINASVDLAEALGTSVEGAAQRLARTLQGDLSARLVQAIPELADFTEEQLRSGEAIDFVNERYGGLARQQRTIFDQVDMLRGSWEDLRGELVRSTLESEHLREVFDTLNNIIIDVANAAEGMDLGEILSEGIVITTTGVLDLSEALVLGARNMGRFGQQGRRVAQVLTDRLAPGLRGGVALLRSYGESSRESSLEDEHWVSVARGRLDALRETLSGIESNKEGDEDRTDSVREQEDALRSARDRERELAEARRRAEERAREAAQRERELAQARERGADEIVQATRRVQIMQVETERERVELLHQFRESDIQSMEIAEDQKSMLLMLAEMERNETLENLRRQDLEDFQRNEERKREAAQRRREQEMQEEHFHAMQAMNLAQMLGNTIASEQEGATARALVSIAQRGVAFAIEGAIRDMPFPANLVAAGGAGLAAGALFGAVDTMISRHIGGMIDSAHTGRMIRSDERMAVVRRDEAVLDRHQVERLGGRGGFQAANAGTARGGGGGLTINLNALDGESVAMSLREGGTLNRALRDAFARGDI
jgi:hypothetical protein